MLADRYGTTAYATLVATWAVQLILVKALAPLAAELLWHTAGLSAVLDTAAGCCLLRVAGLDVARRVEERASVRCGADSRRVVVADQLPSW